MNIAEDKMASTESNSPSAPGEKQSVSPSQHTDLTESTSSENFQADTLRKFSYSELAEATNSFSNSVCLGGGTFGIVYRGCLPIGDFAVKKLYYTGDGQHIEEFENRINVIGMARHRHLVSLIGYCCEEYDRLLVLEFVPNRSLRFHLRDAERRSKLKWSKRMKIAIGSAKGLKYLHEYCEPKIIHGGIKSDNILLDRNFEPKVADFGLAILLEGYDAARIYVDSNISDLEKISELDIYSFGVTLLELITGRKIYEDEYIVKWARPLMIKGDSINVDYDGLVDSTLKGQYDQSEVERIIYCIAASIYTPSSKLRPKMGQILEALEGLIPHQQLWAVEEHKEITEVSNQLWSKATPSQGTGPKIMQIQEMPAESNYSALEPAAMLSETSLEATAQSAIPPSRLMKIYHILNKIVSRIKNSNVSTIGVYGGEGIGKTTLSEALKIQPAIRDMFHFVIWVSVPKVWNLREVQLQIGRQLPLSGKKRINKYTLMSFLESVKFILILDGVNGFISLNIVGIPEPTPENGSKIVLTARSAEVCDRMSADLKINLEDLFRELFCENVGEIVYSFKLQPLAPKVVDLCCNHSHAIFLMSKALKDESDVRVWKNAVDMLSRQPASPEQEIENIMVNILKFSYDRLPDDTTRRCLKNCALFFEKQEIARESLIDNWISDDLMDMYQKGQKVIETLVTAGLLESSEDGQVFKLHEIDSSLLLEHVFPSRLFLRRKGSTLTELLMDENWENSDEIYLMDNELTELSEKLSSQAQALFLQRNLKLRKISDTFFQDMLALQILNLSVTSIKFLPDSLFGLVNLKRLSLNRCVLLKLLPSRVGDLSCLEVLHLEGTAIVALPREVEHLKNLTSLKVSFREPVIFDHPKKMIPDGVIKKLSKLKKLRIDVSPEDGRWKASVVSIVLEVCTLTTLDTLQFYFPNVKLLSQINWDTTPTSPPLSHFKFIVGDHTNRIICRLPHDVDVELGRYDKCLKYVNGEGAPEEIKKVLRHTSAFFLDRNMSVEKLSEFEISNMMQLKCCVAGECDKLQTIIEGDQMVTSASGEVELGLESLEYLYIYYAKSLRSICEGRLDNSSFKKLKYLTLHMCPELTIIFMPELLVNLSSLEELIVDDCSEVKSLVHCKDNEHEIKHILPALKKISFHFLPELDSISDVVSIAPRIEWMDFYYCPNLKSLPISKAIHTKLRQIKGEESWWQSLEWQNNEQDSNWEDIFTPVDEWD
uniref:non-specific serine/threonine protein kinase n=2 Tax=Manihot esculenta TaxID=3983 RepID=A0A2C9V7D9_MANES